MGIGIFEKMGISTDWRGDVWEGIVQCDLLRLQNAAKWVPKIFLEVAKTYNDGFRDDKKGPVVMEGAKVIWDLRIRKS